MVYPVRRGQHGDMRRRETTETRVVRLITYGSTVKRHFACTLTRHFTCARSPAVTVALDAGGADTYTSQAIPGP
jgi:hypothetical protein